MEQRILSPVMCKTVFCNEDLGYYELFLTTGVVEKSRDFQIIYRYCRGAHILVARWLWQLNLIHWCLKFCILSLIPSSC